MIYRLCRRCKKVIGYSESYCSKCLPIIEEQRNEYKKKRENRYNKNRDPKYKEFYNSKEWKMLSYKKMQDSNYMCEYKDCENLATEVHHKIPIREDWNKRLDYDNLMCLCVEHHNQIHNRFQKKKRLP